MLTVLIKASSRYPIRRKLIKETVANVLRKMNVSGDVEVEVNIVGDRKMTHLHEKYMGEQGTTDVLSFPLHESYLKNQDQKMQEEIGFVDYPDKVLRLGTIVVSYPQAQRQANLHKQLVDDEINQLVEHGMLHLLGIHHE
ncbi:MAG: rRNA maturation RNase YbeY [Patescibacteria group bacterium]|jgi:probable rRNA maturation factor